MPEPSINTINRRNTLYALFIAGMLVWFMFAALDNNTGPEVGSMVILFFMFFQLFTLMNSLVLIILRVFRLFRNTSLFIYNLSGTFHICLMIGTIGLFLSETELDIRLLLALLGINFLLGLGIFSDIYKIRIPETRNRPDPDFVTDKEN